MTLEKQGFHRLSSKISAFDLVSLLRKNKVSASKSALLLFATGLAPLRLNVTPLRKRRSAKLDNVTAYRTVPFVKKTVTIQAGTAQHGPLPESS